MSNQSMQARTLPSTQGQPTTSQDAVAAMDAVIRQARQELNALQASGTLPPDALPSAGQTKGELDSNLIDFERAIDQLNTIQRWMGQNPALIHFIDEYIGQRFQTTARQQNRFNLWITVTTTIIGAILGWLLSLVGSPTSFLHLIGR